VFEKSRGLAAHWGPLAKGIGERVKQKVVTIAALVGCLIVLTGGAGAIDLDTIGAEVAAAQRSYDVQNAKQLLSELSDAVDDSSSEEAKFGLARAALLVAELIRLDYEQNDLPPKESRVMGREIDDAARIGHEILKSVPNVSEKFRIKADLWGTMIRSDFKGKKYGGEMDSAAKKALKLGPENPNAYVTASKRPLFATEKQGGDIPKAIGLLDKALALDPEHERALIFRGIAREKLDDMEGALQDWNRATELNPNSRLATENIERVGHLGE